MGTTSNTSFVTDQIALKLLNNGSEFNLNAEIANSLCERANITFPAHLITFSLAPLACVNSLQLSRYICEQLGIEPSETPAENVQTIAAKLEIGL